jgi:hypothetical protein
MKDGCAWEALEGQARRRAAGDLGARPIGRVEAEVLYEPLNHLHVHGMPARARMVAPTSCLISGGSACARARVVQSVCVCVCVRA